MLEPLKSMFVGKDEIIDLLGVCVVAVENLFLHGPPGTAKSALAQALAQQLDGRMFDYLLTRFTEPNELFGPPSRTASANDRGECFDRRLE